MIKWYYLYYISIYACYLVSLIQYLLQKKTIVVPNIKVKLYSLFFLWSKRHSFLVLSPKIVLILSTYDTKSNTHIILHLILFIITKYILLFINQLFVVWCWLLAVIVPFVSWKYRNKVSSNKWVTTMKLTFKKHFSLFMISAQHTVLLVLPTGGKKRIVNHYSCTNKNDYIPELGKGSDAPCALAWERK